MTHETAVEMALVVEAGGQGNFGQVLTRVNELSCQGDAPLKDIGVGSQPQLAREAADQLEAAETRFPGECCEGELGRGVVVDPGSCTADAGSWAVQPRRFACRVFAEAREKLQKGSL